MNKNNFKVGCFYTLLLTVFLGFQLQSCKEDECCDSNGIKVITAPEFTVKNISVISEKELSASSSTPITSSTINLTLEINGITQSFTSSYNSNELPALIGDEIEIIASFDDNSATANVCFIMPDGSRQFVTKTNPVCKWRIPADFLSGDKIIAQWANCSGKIKHKSTSTYITLISLTNENN